MSRPRLLVDLRPLREAAFRRVWAGFSLSTLGGQLTVVAVLYQVWELSGNAVAVGAVGLAQAVPMIGFGLLGGALADAVDRRRLVLVATAGQTVVAASLAGQALAGLDSLAVLLALVGAQAAFGGLGAPARRTFPARLLPPAQVAAGIALTSLTFQLALLAGPAIAGMVVARWGPGAAFGLDAVTFLVAGYSVLRLPALRPEGGGDGPSGPAGAVRATWRGARFILRRPVLGGAFATDLVATVLGMPIALFPVVNADRFGGDPRTLGLFLTAVAVGGIAAGAASGLLTRSAWSARPGAVMLAGAAVWGLALAGFGLAEPIWLTLGCLAVAGAADTVSVISRGTIVQLATPDSHRGRVSAVEHVIGVAGPDLGNFRAGLLAGATSAAFAAVSGGLACVVGILAVALGNRALRRFRTSDNCPAAPVAPT